MASRVTLHKNVVQEGTGLSLLTCCHGLSNRSRADVVCSLLNFILCSSCHTPRCLPGMGGSLWSLGQSHRKGVPEYAPTSFPAVPPPMGSIGAESWAFSKQEASRRRKWRLSPKMAPCVPSRIKPSGKGGLKVRARVRWTLWSESV